MTREEEAEAVAFGALEIDVHHLFSQLAQGAYDVAGRGKAGVLKASPEFYRMIADEVMDFAVLHPEHARSALADILELMEMQPTFREKTIKRRAALKKAGVM